VNVADAAVRAGVKRLIFMSTDSTVGYNRDTTMFDSATPPSPYKNYGMSKWRAEEYLYKLQRQNQLNVTTLRGFWFFGPHVPTRNLSFLQMFRWPFQLVFGNGKNLRSISHLDDLIQAFQKAEPNPATYGKFYWIPSLGKPMTVDQIYQMLGNGLGKKTSLVHVPNFICDMLDFADTLLTKVGILNETIHAAGKFHKNIAGTDTDAKRDFGYEPTVTEAQIQAEIRQALDLG
jgi:UDP-glucose 4-epimerase